MSNWKVIQGDCLDVLRSMPDASVDAVVTDPPYGINVAPDGRIGGSNVAESTQYRAATWDEKGLSTEQWSELKRVSKTQVVFGFNHLTDVLGPCSGVIVWDKKCKNNWFDNFSDCELAWTSKRGPARVYRHMWMGALRASEKEAGARVHPTQKPVELMRWVVENWVGEGATVLDPFCGSGTTGVACVQTGRNFIGIELDPGYCDIARRRIADAVPLCAEVAK